MLVTILFALFLALVFAGILVGTFGWRRPGNPETGPALFFLFLIFFFGLWAAAVWVEPIGPVLWSVAWLPLLIVGLIVALVVMAVTPPRTTVAQEPAPAVGLSAFFWVLLLLLIFAAASGTWWWA